MAVRYKIGLDIGFSSIKAVVLDHSKKPPQLVSVGHVASPQPGIISEAELDLEAVANAIKSLFADIKPPTKDVIVALPESRIFTRVIYDLPYLSDDELTQAIKYAAEEFVPMPIAEVNLYYQVIFRSPKKELKSRTVVFVIASPKKLIEKYLKVLQIVDLKPLAIETELLASARALVNINTYSPTTLMVQIGSVNTDFAIVSEGLILLTRSISTGGVAMTRAISQSFNFEFAQSEEYKKVYGMLEDQLEGKLYKTLKPLVDIVVAESKRVILAHESQNKQRSVKRIVLTGGAAQLPGLVKYFADTLGLEVQEADPWVGVTVDPALKTKLAAEGPFYTIAAGLALREEN